VGLKTLNDLEIALRQNKWLEEILERFEEVALPDGWLVAGCIAQTIWNLGYGQPAEFGLKDVDIIYFDEQDLSFEAEACHERRLRDLFQHLPIKLDAKNEAGTIGKSPDSRNSWGIRNSPGIRNSLGIRNSRGIQSSSRTVVAWSRRLQ
jgi:hypothetical protein